MNQQKIDQLTERNS